MIRRIENQSGFSYIDVIIAIFILMIGILAMVSALTANLMRIYESEKRAISKQIALSTIESIISAKEIKTGGLIEGWQSIGNVGSNLVAGTPRGIFLSDWRPIREDLGPDGVAGTADDACQTGTVCESPGKPPNASLEIEGFERRIVISDVEDPERPSPTYAVSRRRIEVSIRFHVNQAIRQEVISTLITNY